MSAIYVVELAKVFREEVANIQVLFLNQVLDNCLLGVVCKCVSMSRSFSCR